MEAATQPQAYEHGQTIFGLAVAPPIGGSPLLQTWWERPDCTTLPAELSVMARLLAASMFRRFGVVSAFFCEIANKNAVCFGVSALRVSLAEDVSGHSLSSRKILLIRHTCMADELFLILGQHLAMRDCSDCIADVELFQIGYTW